MDKIYMVVYVDVKKGLSALREVIQVKNEDKEMYFLDNKNQPLYLNEVLQIGDIKNVSYTIEWSWRSIWINWF